MIGYCPEDLVGLRVDCKKHLHARRLLFQTICITEWVALAHAALRRHRSGVGRRDFDLQES